MKDIFIYNWLKLVKYKNLLKWISFPNIITLNFQWDNLFEFSHAKFGWPQKLFIFRHVRSHVTSMSLSHPIFDMLTHGHFIFGNLLNIEVGPHLFLNRCLIECFQEGNYDVWGICCFGWCTSSLNFSKLMWNIVVFGCKIKDSWIKNAFLWRKVEF